jgi:hypothetical protein
LTEAVKNVGALLAAVASSGLKILWRFSAIIF